MDLFDQQAEEINGFRVRQARELKGLTQVALADLLGVNQTMIAQIEAGTKQPSSELFADLATELELPQRFFRQSNPSDFPNGTLLFRSKLGVGKKRIAQLRAHASVTFEFVLQLSREATLVPVRLPVCRDPEDAARHVRQLMGMTDGPIFDLTRAIEKLGVLVLPLPDLEDCDAFAVWAGPGLQYPVIGIVVARVVDRTRMSLAHELGHLVLHRYVGSVKQEFERDAYRFAAELLMPRDATIADLRAEKVTLFRLAELKNKWGLSMQAVARRAKEMDVINERQYRYLMQQFSARGWRVTEPSFGPPLKPERPRAIRKLAEVVFGEPLNVKKIARDATLSDEFIRDLIDRCEPAPKQLSNSVEPEREVIPFAGRGARSIRQRRPVH
jgi:Zn-dependent peptidase ImmA (M78 family)/DNA-binding XRE family transcriptional regulator